MDPRVRLNLCELVGHQVKQTKGHLSCLQLSILSPLVGKDSCTPQMWSFLKSLRCLSLSIFLVYRIQDLTAYLLVSIVHPTKFNLGAGQARERR